MLQLILPFIVVSVICLLCGDVEYGRLLLSTSTLGGFGDCVGTSWAKDSLLSARAINITEGRSIHWISLPMTSDDLLLLLDAEYFTHAQDRLAGIVIADHIQWIRSDVIVLASSLQMPIWDFYDNFMNIQNNSCSNEPSSIICQSSVSMTRYGNDSALKISTVDYLQSNLTILLNSTSEHSAPIFFKEVLPSIDFSPADQVGHQGSFTLYTYPLQTISHANTAVLIRGFVVSNMVILYLLLLSIASVKSIVNFRGDGTKHQV